MASQFIAAAYKNARPAADDSGIARVGLGVASPFAALKTGDLARIYWAGMADRSALDESERQRFDALVTMSFSAWDQEYEFFLDGMMSERMWKRCSRAMLTSVQPPGMQQWWNDWGTKIYEPEFCDFVDGLIREGEAAE